MKMFLRLCLFVVTLAPLWGRVDLLLVPPAEPISAAPGSKLTLYANNPTSEEEGELRLPKSVTAMYVTKEWRGKVQFEVESEPATDGPIVEIKVAAMTSRKLTLRLLDALPATDGFVSIRLVNPDSNTIMFQLQPSAAPVGSQPPPAVVAQAEKAETARTSPKKVENRPKDLDLRSDVEGVRRHISGYDPIYFAVGSRDRLNARFQFSFKYRMLEPQADPEVIRDFYFAYTQTSIWDLESFSKPFYDSSYKPTVFFLREQFKETGFWSHIGLQVGAQHESNGKGGSASLLSGPTTSTHPRDTRSLNSVYLTPKFRWSAPESGWFVEVAPRIIGYLQMDENPDLAHYRGHVELLLRGGFDRAGQVSLHLRGSPRHRHGSVEVNATWPMNKIMPKSWLETLHLRDLVQAGGGYFQIQYFNGYGESLLDYDVRRKDQLRFGLEIVR